MEDYDEVVIKTVRDLFRSYPLLQIKKYMMTKEGEINDKDNELKNLILNKYSSLINGIEGLEKISSNLNSLENIKEEFSKKLNEIDFEKIETSLKNITFDSDIFEDINNKNIFNYEEKEEKIQNFLSEKKFKEAIDEMSIIKTYLNENINNNYDNIYGINIKEKYYFNLVELVEGIMNLMIEDNNICKNLDEYIVLFGHLHEKLIKDNYQESIEYLIMSELYLKILYDKNIQKIIDEYFSFLNNENQIQNFFSLKIILKILLLKISQILYDLSETSIEILFNDISIEKFLDIYQIVRGITYIFKKHFSNENDLTKFYCFIKSEINKNINSLLIIPRYLLEKLYLNKAISYWNNLFNKNDNDDLVEFLFLDKSIEQISNITSYILKQYSSQNLLNLKIFFKNKNIQKENDILLSLLQLKKIKNEKNYKKKFLDIIQNKFCSFFTEINKNILTNDIEYINIIMNIISDEQLMNLLKEFKLDNIMSVINEIIQKNQNNDFEKIKKYINDNFKTELNFELYIKEEQLKLYNNNSLTESLKQLIEVLYEFDIKDKKHKIAIYKNVIQIYKDVLKNYFTKKGGTLKNYIIINDIYILKNINEDIDSINSLIEQIKNDYKVDINNKKDNIENFEGFLQLKSFFTEDNYYINKNNKIKFDINKYIINKPTKVEYFPIYVNKMHVYMLNKTKIDYTDRDNSVATTFNICDYRIEENYLSIKQEKIGKNENNTNNNKIEVGNVLGNITGKLFNFMNDD